jgi:hypothetical protein
MDHHNHMEYNLQDVVTGGGQLKSGHKNIRVLQTEMGKNRDKLINGQNLIHRRPATTMDNSPKNNGEAPFSIEMHG